MRRTMAPEIVAGILLSLGIWLPAAVATAQPSTPAIDTIPGMPPVRDPRNLYSETGPDKLSPAIANVPTRVYVPNVKSNEVHVIDPATLKVIDRFRVGT